MAQEGAKKHQEDNSRYKLFIGFKKLGEFSSISEAKRYADNSGLLDVFNLIGDKYEDSWYITSLSKQQQ